MPNAVDRLAAVHDAEEAQTLALLVPTADLGGRWLPARAEDLERGQRCFVDADDGAGREVPDGDDDDVSADVDAVRVRVRNV